MSFPTGVSRKKPPAFKAGDVFSDSVASYRIVGLAGREYRHDRMDYVYRAVCTVCGAERLLYQRQVQKERLPACPGMPVPIDVDNN